MAGLRTLGQEGGHLVGSTPRLWPFYARRGREGGHLVGSTPWLWLFCASRSEREDT